MCNIAYEWDKSSRFVGVAWVVRNHRGVVLFHSRNSFTEVGNKEEAKLLTILWAMEKEFGAVLRPKDWPAFAFQSGVISKSIQAMNDAQLLVVSRNYNRGTSFIAKSVIRENRHLYVASGPPGWLFELFINESRDF
ncbi:unnamed protein product [Brassica rapa]|uniref:RNase H type-1 domain-containing protein n=1 Tax=Brassica campestris TaxID=3711 RepID=A0A3P6A8E8_BRACM|nr:unnamed protein product [Brassica rapa]VDC90016.1 unnamed protein product [Brassica rapa]